MARNEEPMTLNMVTSRVFDASVEQVWKAWSDSELVKQWWGPTGFTSPFANMDFRVGGTSLVCMRAPQEYGGFDMYNTWTYTRIVPQDLIEFVQHFTDKDGNKIDPSSMGVPPDVPAEVPHRIVFKSLDAGKTEIHITEYGYNSEATVNQSKMGMDQCLDKMAAILK
jgi:uncharacterized protein YndB with AHSA1/START domain